MEGQDYKRRMIKEAALGTNAEYLGVASGVWHPKAQPPAHAAYIPGSIRDDSAENHESNVNAFKATATALLAVALLKFVSQSNVTGTKLLGIRSLLQGKILGKVPVLSKLCGVSTLHLSKCQLTIIPNAVLSMRSIVRLDLSSNQIAQVPADIKCLQRLQELSLARNSLTGLPPSIGSISRLTFLNLMGNKIESLPATIGLLSKLVRLGLKDNQLKQLPDTIGQLTSLKEVFLTNNRLQSLPKSFGNLSSMVKVQASHNQFRDLPSTIGQLQNLEMLRVAVAHIQSIPHTFQQLPKLAWFSYAGNPGCANRLPDREVPEIEYTSLTIGDGLGGGASGDVFLAEMDGKTVAVKRLKDEGISPDGSPEQEKRISLFLDHPNLVKVVAKTVNPEGMVMNLCPGQVPCDRPNFSNLLRDIWPKRASFTQTYVVNVSLGVASALGYMHKHNICHGDVYAHNVIVDGEGDSVVLCDMGAAFVYNPSENDIWQPMDVRGFGLMVADLVDRWSSAKQQLYDDLVQLTKECQLDRGSKRPSFEAIATRLAAVKKQLV